MSDDQQSAADYVAENYAFLPEAAKAKAIELVEALRALEHQPAAVNSPLTLRQAHRNTMSARDPIVTELAALLNRHNPE